MAEIENNPCYLCARMRRGYLYSHAKELGCNKIALGHHFDDVIETILMGMLYSGKVGDYDAEAAQSEFEGMELIRPMYLIKDLRSRHGEILMGCTSFSVHAVLLRTV